MKTIPTWARILILAFILYQALITYHDKWYCHCTVGGDFVAYYQFGQGVRETVWPKEYQPTVDQVIGMYGGKANFMYADATYPVFYLLARFDMGTAYLIWYCVQLLCALLLAWVVMKIEWGWLWILAGMKIIIFNFASGNIALILAAFSVTTIGCFVSAIFKPYYLFFAYLPSIIHRNFVTHKRISIIGLTLIVAGLSFPNAYIQVIQGNDGTTWAFNKYWILFAPLFITMSKSLDVVWIKKYWYWNGILAGGLLIVSAWNWWLSAKSRALIATPEVLLWFILIEVTIILAVVVFLFWLLVHVFGQEEDRGNWHT